MAQTASTTPTVATSTDATGRLKRRLGIVGAAILAGLATWAIASLATDIRVDNRGTIAQIGPAAVIFAATAAALAGWAALAVFERLTPRARTVWTVLAVIVLVVSLGGAFTGVDGASVAALAALHLTVGGVVIAGLRHTTQNRTP